MSYLSIDMAYRKRIVRRKRISKRKVGKRMMVRRSPGLRQPVHYFKRTQFATNVITVSGGASYFGASSFEIQNLPNFNEFTSLYDQYKLTAIKYQILPRGNSADVGTSATQGNQGRIFSVIDYDDSNAPASFNDMTQYQNLKSTPNTMTHTRYFKPKFIMDVLSGGVGLTANAPRSGWIDCTQADVKHRGIKIGIQAPNATATWTYDLMVTYYLAFKNVR